MGNRAIISCKNMKNEPAIYLHWNGGPESILAFLHAAKDLGIRSPGGDDSYFLARFAQIIGNWFGGELSVGICSLGDGEVGDNGHYILGNDFSIRERRGNRYGSDKNVCGLGELDPEAKRKYEGIRAAVFNASAKLYGLQRYRMDKNGEYPIDDFKVRRLPRKKAVKV